MEILATNVDNSAVFGVIMFAILAAVALIVSIVCREKYVLFAVAWFAAVSIGLYFDSGKEVTYDAIITDWNEVYEQGYEIVEQNGKIVTLRKVDD